jgi:hypothetical protein
VGDISVNTAGDEKRGALPLGGLLRVRLLRLLWLLRLLLLLLLLLLLVLVLELLVLPVLALLLVRRRLALIEPWRTTTHRGLSMLCRHRRCPMR